MSRLIILVVAIKSCSTYNSPTANHNGNARAEERKDAKKETESKMSIYFADVDVKYIYMERYTRISSDTNLGHAEPFRQFT